MTAVRYELNDQIAEIVLDSAPVNALTVPMIDEVLAALARARDDAEARVVILRSGDNAFEILGFRSMARTAWHELETTMHMVASRAGMKI